MIRPKKVDDNESCRCHLSLVGREGRDTDESAPPKQELAYARAGDDPFVEKASLERLGLVRARLGDSAGGLRCLERALYLARSVRDRQHQAKLLWQLAIVQAEQGERAQAIGRGEEAIALLESLATPEARIYRDYFERYRAGADHEVRGTEVRGTEVLGKEYRVPLLRLALAAVKSLARFAVSGFQTAAPRVRQQRLDTCSACPQHTGLRCRPCGCFTELKARLAHEQCPLGNGDRPE